MDRAHIKRLTIIFFTSDTHSAYRSTNNYYYYSQDSVAFFSSYFMNICAYYILNWSHQQLKVSRYL